MNKFNKIKNGIGSIIISATAGIGILPEKSDQINNSGVDSISHNIQNNLHKAQKASGGFLETDPATGETIVLARELVSSTKSESIKQALEFIISDLSRTDIDGDSIELHKQQLRNIHNLIKLYDVYINTAFTNTTNIKLSQDFNNIISLVKSGDDLSGAVDNINMIIENEQAKLNDQFFIHELISEPTVRDFIEQHIDFKNNIFNDTYNETQEMELILSAFTVEYLNIIGDRYDRNYKDLNVTHIELGEIMNKVVDRLNNHDTLINYKIEFTIKNGEKITHTIKTLDKNGEKIKIDLTKDKVVISEDPEIRELQKKHGIRHINKTKRDKNRNITYGVNTERWKPILESSKAQLMKVYNTDIEAKNGLNNGKLIDLRTIENKYFSLDKKLLEHSTKTYVSPDTLLFINNVGKEFLDKTGTKVHITSLLRTGDINKSTSGASEISAHQMGVGVDFRNLLIPLRHRVILKDILEKRDLSNNSIFIEESDHFHVTILDYQHAMNDKYPKYNKLNLRAPKRGISEYLASEGDLDETTKIILQDIFAKAQIDYTSFDQAQLQQIHKNYITLINFIVFIESNGGQYLDNYNGSTASGPFQIIDGFNKHGAKRSEYKDGNFTTLETWARRYNMYANNSSEPLSASKGSQPEFIDKILEGKIGANDLSEEQSINLFSIGSFWYNKEKAELLLKALLKGDRDAMEQIYIYHHSNPDKETESKMLESMNIYGPALVKVIK